MSTPAPPLTEHELYALFNYGLPTQRLEAALPNVAEQLWVYNVRAPYTKRSGIATSKLLDFKAYLVMRGHHETALRLQTVEAMLALENL